MQCTAHMPKCAACKVPCAVFNVLCAFSIVLCLMCNVQGARCKVHSAVCWVHFQVCCGVWHGGLAPLAACWRHPSNQLEKLVSSKTHQMMRNEDVDVECG